jgi:lipoprotein-releasing system ATP-binding protein
MDEPVLRLQGVVRDFGERVITRVLHGIDLLLRRREFAALTGPSGSGKSTLLNLIGLLDRPTRGTIAITGQETTHLGDEQLTRLRGRTIGFIFQFHHLLPAFTALENVVIPALADGGSRDGQMYARATQLLRRVGLPEKLHAKATELSGGQQQRVAVARALVMNPPLVLADEPTGNLDTRSADEVFELLRKINHEEGTAFLIVTHDPQLAARCDRTIDLVDGRIRSDRPNLAG